MKDLFSDAYLCQATIDVVKTTSMKKYNIDLGQPLSFFLFLIVSSIVLPLISPTGHWGSVALLIGCVGLLITSNDFKDSNYLTSIQIFDEKVAFTFMFNSIQTIDIAKIRLDYKREALGNTSHKVLYIFEDKLLLCRIVTGSGWTRTSIEEFIKEFNQKVAFVT